MATYLEPFMNGTHYRLAVWGIGRCMLVAAWHMPVTGHMSMLLAAWHMPVTGLAAG